MRPSIHFASLVCPEYDHDIIEPWAAHYAAFGFDTYSVFLHYPTGDFSRKNYAEQVMRAHGFRIVDTLGPDSEFREGKLRHKLLTEFQEALSAGDKMVVADSDEFHDVGRDYADIVREYDIVTGHLVDRFDITAHEADPEKALIEQYPFFGRMHDIIRTKFLEDAGGNFPPVKSEKILSVSKHVPVWYGGSHSVMQTRTSDRICPSDFHVLHYSWRRNIIKRMAGKRYYKPIHMWYVMKMFGIEEPPAEFWQAVALEEAEQNSKGWVPA